MAHWNSQTTHTDISGFSDNPELRRELKALRRKIAAWVIAVIAVIGISAKPSYRAFREYRINKNLEAAQAAARLEDWSTARDKARSVLLVRRDDFEAYRIWTRALGRMAEPRTYMAAAAFFTDPRATREDQVEALQVLALQAPQAVALSAYASLPEKQRKEPGFLAALSPLLIQRGEIALAEKGLREAAQTANSPTVQLELLRALCCRPDAARVTEARQIFADLITAHADDAALKALLILGEMPGGLAPGAPLPNLPQWLKDQPKATAQHHLLGMHPDLEAKPESAERVYDSAIERFLSTEPGVLGSWLARHNQAERAVKILAEPAKTRSDAYLSLLQALLRLNRFDELTTALANPPGSIDLVDVEIVRATLASKRGDKIGAAAAWTRALNAAAFDATHNRFIEIARIADAFGARDACDDAWVASLRSGWGQIPLYRDLEKVYASLLTKGRSEDLLAMYRTLLRFEPKNAELNNNFNYLGLIHGVLPPNEATKAQSELIEAHPDQPEFSSALMLAELLDGKPTEALALLPKLRECRGVSPMMKTALEGTARTLAGETAAGTAMLRDINWRYFLRQERVVFRDVLIKLKISEIPLPELDPVAPEADPEQFPAWRKMLERLEKERAKDVLPALPAAHIPGADAPSE